MLVVAGAGFEEASGGGRPGVQRNGRLLICRSFLREPPIHANMVCNAGMMQFFKDQGEESSLVKHSNANTCVLRFMAELTACLRDACLGRINHSGDR